MYARVKFNVISARFMRTSTSLKVNDEYVNEPAPHQCLFPAHLLKTRSRYLRRTKSYIRLRHASQPFQFAVNFQLIVYTHLFTKARERPVSTFFSLFASHITIHSLFVYSFAQNVCTRTVFNAHDNRFFSIRVKRFRHLSKV